MNKKYAKQAQSIGERIQEHRKARHLTQEQLAHLAQVSYTTLAKIESGAIKSPSIDKASQIASALGASLDDFMMVQTYRGPRSLNRIWRDILETLDSGDYMYITGIDEREYLNADRSGIEKFISEIGKRGLFQRLLSCEGDEFRFEEDYIEYRWVPREFFNPNPIYVYGDKLAAVIWGPPQQAVILKNAVLADAYRKQFLYMWEMARKFHTKLT